MVQFEGLWVLLLCWFTPTCSQSLGCAGVPIAGHALWAEVSEGIIFEACWEFFGFIPTAHFVIGNCTTGEESFMDGVIVCAVTYCFCASTSESARSSSLLCMAIRVMAIPGNCRQATRGICFPFWEFFLVCRSSLCWFLGLLIGHLWVGRAWHPGTRPHGVSFGVFNVGGWLTHGGFAMEGDVDFLAAVEHRIVPAWVRNEHKGYTRARPHPGNCSIPQCFRRRKKGSVVCIGHERVLDERVNGWTRPE